MTRQPDTQRIATVLTERFGLALTANLGANPEGTYVDLRPTDLHANEGFNVRTTLGWRHVHAQLQLGRFAADLMRHMAAANAEQRARFLALVKLASDSGGKSTLAINGFQVDLLLPESWPAVEWVSLELQVERTPLMIDHEDPSKLEDTIVFWGGCLLGMAVSLLPVEEIEELEIHGGGGLPEGARQRVVVNRYERNRINRMLCISVYGTSCVACGFNFLAMYGEMGRDFIHIHHVVPLSKLGAGYVINPASDLVPVCPNCHAMLHRCNPPLSVVELRTLLDARS